MDIQQGCIPIMENIDKNIDAVKTILSDNQSLIYKRFESASEESIQFCSIFIKNLCDTKEIVESIIKPIMSKEISSAIEADKRINFILLKVMLTHDNNKIETIDDCINNLVKGNAVLFIEGCKEAVVVDTSKRKERAIEEPESNKVSRGPKLGFTESIDTNVALIQQIIHNQDLKIRYLTLGTQTKTQICISYMENIASDKIVEEVFKRIREVELDGILDSYYIESFIEDSPLSVFPTIGFTDRPDIACAKLLEGRVVVICDGSPQILTLPHLLVENFQTNEDYYKSYTIASFYRILRYISFAITSLTPAIYLAMVNYHQELIPTNLLFSIMAARNSIPFPTILELLLMLLVFETLIEASRRLPPNIGPTVSIVGGLILGQAAISARLVSAPIIIMTAVSGTTSFLLPFTTGPVVFIRLFCLAFSAILGFYGLVFSLILITTYMLSLKSFGVPYTMGLTTFRSYDVQDTIIRLPWWYMKYRIRIIAAKNLVRNSSKKKFSTR
ncbi:spore germination protein [Clostridium sp. CX1]|uniref:spore germination protein n=1 Tax=Clostridium sp. CX1 TaxID=2978346 RepID=UPI0021BEA13D|nr:spore germination protein [Clostridium sp. CX1]MCT8977955.1 spore germination protein [Clostridium sp. CX1]